MTDDVMAGSAEEASVVALREARLVESLAARPVESLAARPVEPLAACPVAPLAACLVAPLGAYLVEPLAACLVEPPEACLVEPLEACLVEWLEARPVDWLEACPVESLVAERVAVERVGRHRASPTSCSSRAGCSRLTSGSPMVGWAPTMRRARRWRSTRASHLTGGGSWRGCRPPEWPSRAGSPPTEPRRPAGRVLAHRSPGGEDPQRHLAR